MTKGNFFRYYNKLTGADRTLVFFERKGIIYIYNCKHIAPRWAHEEFESSKNGGAQKFKMYISVAEKDKLIAKGATPVMTKAEFEAIPYKNKGHKCEYYLHKACGLGEYTQRFGLLQGVEAQPGDFQGAQAEGPQKKACHQVSRNSRQV